MQALKGRVAQLQAAAQEREAASEHEVARLRKANQVLEAHLEMLRSNLEAEAPASEQVQLPGCFYVEDVMTLVGSRGWKVPPAARPLSWSGVMSGAVCAQRCGAATWTPSKP